MTYCIGNNGYCKCKEKKYMAENYSKKNLDKKVKVKRLYENVTCKPKSFDRLSQTSQG
jgi:hypothetical protein